MEIVLLSKQDEWSEKAAAVARAILGDSISWTKGVFGQPLPEAIEGARPDFLISFLSPWIIPRDLLERSKVAVNFHPASADYPGIGCYNFALYEEAKRYGAVCHFMAERVDSGEIIEERLFDVFPTDTVETLKLRTMITMLSMFHDFLAGIAGGGRATPCGKSWSRKPFTRKQLSALRQITPNMPPDEVRKRVRATTYPGYPGAAVTLGGVEFVFAPPSRPPLA